MLYSCLSIASPPVSERGPDKKGNEGTGAVLQNLSATTRLN